MEVKKEIYYHANSNKEYQKGDILIFNRATHNKMYEEVYNKKYNYNEMDANELLYNKKKNNDYVLSKEEFELLFNTVNNDAFVIRELALEEVRKNKYPDYPSRLNALYVTKDKEDAIKWGSILKRNGKICKQILTLELTGTIFIGDGNLIKRQNISYQEQIKIAEKYWNQTSNKIEEYLFYGQAKVIDIDYI